MDGGSTSHSHSAVNTGKTILTALYVCMLGICFVVPVFFYFRMQCEDRYNRRLRDMEIAAMARAISESQDMHREETRAARKKYQEETRARILQLFAPVRMVRIATQRNATCNVCVGHNRTVLVRRAHNLDYPYCIPMQAQETRHITSQQTQHDCVGRRLRKLFRSRSFCDLSPYPPAFFILVLELYSNYIYIYFVRLAHSQYNTMQCNTMQCNAIQYNTIQQPDDCPSCCAAQILKEENFVPSSKPTNDSGETITIQNSEDENDDSGLQNQEDKTSQQSIRLGDKLDLELDLESGTKTNTDAKNTTTSAPTTAAATVGPDQSHLEFDDSADGDGLILIPKPGLPVRASLYELTVNTNTNPNIVANNTSGSNCNCKCNRDGNGNGKTVPLQQQQDNSEMRTVTNECPICLCPYKVGSDIVWSSNPHCGHVYHKTCIEEWFMKQKDRPLCPCCRRDFVIDPFDCRPGTTDDLEKGGTAGNGATAGISNATAASGGNAGRAIPAMMPTTSTRTIEVPSSSMVDNVMVAMPLRASIANTMTTSMSMSRLGDSDNESTTSNAAATALELPTGGAEPNTTTTNNDGS